MKHYLPNIEDKKDYQGKLIKNALHTLWKKDSSTLYKLDALDVLARFIDIADTREKLKYFYQEESNHLVAKTMEEILNGTYQPEEILDDIF